jgi:glycosyltransferase involved in cell wall biosynthesis
MISVIIPSYNSEATIMDCLQSIFNQDIAEPFEVIVVDSSCDQTPRLIRNSFPRVKLVHMDHRVDSGTARDIGVRNAQGKLIAFIDSDCTVRPDYLRRVAKNHSSGKYVAVGGPVINGNPQSLISWASYMIEFSEFLPKGSERKAVSHLPTCNLCYKREIFDIYGGFPGNVVMMQCDLLFNWRICKNEKKILFDPAIPVAHHHRTTLISYLRHQYAIGTGTVQVLRRTRLQGSTLVKYPVMVTFMLPVLPLIKFTRTAARCIRWDYSSFLKRPLVVPLLLLGLLWWLAGFAREVYNKQSTARVNAEISLS